MAYNEFVKVMTEWHRMCNYFDEKFGDRCCEECRCHDLQCCAPWEWESDDDFEEIATRIMKWANEHPRPNYLTWKEFFQRINNITIGDLMINWEKEIPENIAKKLNVPTKLKEEED